MDAFVDKLVSESNQWATPSSIRNRKVFESTLETVVSGLPSPIKAALSGNQLFAESLWQKIQEKYSNQPSKSALFHSAADITEHLQSHSDVDDLSHRRNALKSSKAALKHFADPVQVPWFTAFGGVSADDVEHRIDGLLGSEQCDDHWLSLIQFRLHQLTKYRAASLSKTRMRSLSQKMNRLFVHNLGLKSRANPAAKVSVPSLLSQIVVICKEDALCSDFSMNLVSFIRVLLDFDAERHPSFTAILDRMGMEQLESLLTAVWRVVVRRHRGVRCWSNTQRVVFLWTLYECHRRGFVATDCTMESLKWAQSLWALCGMEAVFKGPAIDSLADFMNAIYAQNPLSLADDAAADDLDSDGGDEVDDDAVLEDIQDIADEDLFTVDLGDFGDGDAAKEEHGGDGGGGGECDSFLEDDSGDEADWKEMGLPPTKRHGVDS